MNNLVTVVKTIVRHTL